MTNHPYSQDVITRLHERAESYRQSGPSAAHTAELLDEAAGTIAALIQAATESHEAARRVIAAHDEVDAWMALGWPARTLVEEPSREKARAAFAALRSSVTKGLDQ